MARIFPFCLSILGLAASPAAAQNATVGANLYKQRCQMCHSLNPGQKSPMGPNLVGVIGRKSGTGDFAYSDAMKKAGISWTPALIEQYLAAPAKMVPGGKMVINVADPKQRTDIVAYLQSGKK